MNGETLEVGDRDGSVIVTMREGTQMHWIALPPDTAALAGEAMAKAAYKARNGREPAADRPRLQEQVIERMLMTTAHMIMSLQRQDKTPGQIAKDVVDYCLREVG